MNEPFPTTNKAIKEIQKLLKVIRYNCDMDKNHIRNSGNNGADYIDIKNTGEGTVHLEVGSCCVKTIDHIVPVEFVSMVLSREILTHGSFEKVIDSFDWDDGFKEKLKSKVKRI